MTIGWALLIIAGLYIVERHKLWRSIGPGEVPR